MHYPTLLEFLKNERKFEALLLDNDGTLQLGTERIPGTEKCLGYLRENGIPFRILTNNTGQTKEALALRLTKSGLEVFPEEFVNPADVIESYFREHYVPGTPEKRYFRIGRVGDIPGIVTFTDDPEEIWNCDGAIHNGGIHDWKISLSALLNLFTAKPEAPFIVPNPDLLNPLKRGFSICPNGQAELVIRMLEVRGIVKERIYFGKPYAPVYQEAFRSLGFKPNMPHPEILGVGDLLPGDIAGANQAGISSGLVLTGLTAEEILEHSQIRPKYVFSRLG